MHTVIHKGYLAALAQQAGVVECPEASALPKLQDKCHEP